MTQTFEENNINNILREQDPKNPYFDLEIIEIPKDNFDPLTPVNIINNKIKKCKKNFIVAHLNSRSLNKNIVELREMIQNLEFDALCSSESWLRSRTPKERFTIKVTIFFEATDVINVEAVFDVIIFLPGLNRN